MKKCAILTMDNLDGHDHYDHLLVQPLLNLDWEVDFVSWRSTNTNWNDYLTIIIRSPWDYQDDPAAFLQVLTDIEQSDARLVNSLDTVKWNINKRYLKELEQKGVEIVPTHWVESFDFNAVLGYFSLFKTKQIVIKPTISANAENTFWLKQDTFNLEKKQLKKSLEGRQLMIQPFIPAVVEEGEYSVFYFSGAFSHCILKTPKEGDFRVQEEYGSTLSKVQPSEALLSASEKALNAIPEKVLYARIDLVEFKKSFKVMELELIEPSLYFNLDEKSPIRFAVAFDEWMK